MPASLDNGRGLKSAPSLALAVLARILSVAAGQSVLL